MWFFLVLEHPEAAFLESHIERVHCNVQLVVVHTAHRPLAGFELWMLAQ